MPDINLTLLALTLILLVVSFLVGHDIGTRCERRRCTIIVDSLSAAEECCGRNYDSENDNVVGPCCGSYFRQCDGALVLRLIREDHHHG